MQLDDDQVALRRGAEELEVDAGRDDAIVAGEAQRGGGGRLCRRGEESVDPAEQLVPQRAARRVAEAVRAHERGHGERLRVAQREVGDARQAGLEAVDDVVAALLEREAEVRAHADGHAQARASRHGHRRTDRDHLGVGAAAERAAAREQVGPAARGRQHGHRVTEAAERLRDASDVLVHVVRLRPRERGHEADAKGHAGSLGLRLR